MNIPSYIRFLNSDMISLSRIVNIVMVGIVIVDSIFLLHFISIEYSQDRLLRKRVRNIRYGTTIAFETHKRNDTTSQFD